MFAALANFVLAFGVLWRRHTKPVHFIFAFLAAVTGAWAFTNFVLSILSDYHQAFTVIGRLAFAVAVFIPYAGLNLSWHFPEVYHPVPKKSTRIAVGAAAVFFFLISFSPLIQKTVVFKETGPIPRFGRLYVFYVGYMTFTFAWGVYNLLRSRWKTSSARDRMQVNYCLIGFSLSFVAAYFCNFALPQLTEASNYYFLGSVWPLVWTSFTAYAICRHRLMDIGIAFRNLLIRGTIALALGVGFLLPFAAHRWLFHGNDNLVDEVLFTTVMIGLFAVYFQRFATAVEHFIDHRIFRGRYDYETALMRFGKNLMQTYGRDEIAGLAVEQVPIIMQAAGAAVYLPEGDGGGYELAAASDANFFKRQNRLNANDLLVKRVALNRERLLRDDVEYGIHSARETELVQRFTEQHAVLMTPLVSQEQVVGMLFLGEKTNDNIYASGDLQLLDALTSQLAFALDNTRLYERIVESEKLYSTILGHMQRGVLAVDAKMRVTSLNNTMSELFECAPDELVGQPAVEHFPMLAPMLEETLAYSYNQSARETRIVRGTHEFPCECETSVMLDAQGRVGGAIIVCQDLTERKKFEEEMRRMDRLASVGTLAAGIAHEIKNPLVSIQTFAQLLPQRHDDPDFRNGFGKVVNGEIERINHLIRDLLNFASPMSREMGEVNLRELCERALNLLANELRHNKVIVNTEFDERGVTVYGDGEQLYQVILNVLQNAIQSMADGKREISITTRPSPKQDGLGGVRNYVQIRFRDTGAGIESEHLSHIFDPFYSTRENGSGLGLSICHGILKNHGAEIDVQSKLGQGTVFTFFIPAEPHGAAVGVHA